MLKILKYIIPLFISGITLLGTVFFTVNRFAKKPLSFHQNTLKDKENSNSVKSLQYNFSIQKLYNELTQLKTAKVKQNDLIKDTKNSFFAKAQKSKFAKIIGVKQKFYNQLDKTTIEANKSLNNEIEIINQIIMIMQEHKYAYNHILREYGLYLPNNIGIFDNNDISSKNNNYKSEKSISNNIYSLNSSSSNNLNSVAKSSEENSVGAVSIKKTSFSLFAAYFEDHNYINTILYFNPTSNMFVVTDSLNYLKHINSDTKGQSITNLSDTKNNEFINNSVNSKDSILNKNKSIYLKNELTGGVISKVGYSNYNLNKKSTTKFDTNKSLYLQPLLLGIIPVIIILYSPWYLVNREIKQISGARYVSADLAHFNNKIIELNRQINARKKHLLKNKRLVLQNRDKTIDENDFIKKTNNDEILAFQEFLATKRELFEKEYALYSKQITESKLSLRSYRSYSGADPEQDLYDGSSSLEGLKPKSTSIFRYRKYIKARADYKRKVDARYVYKKTHDDLDSLLSLRLRETVGAIIHTTSSPDYSIPSADITIQPIPLKCGYKWIQATYSRVQISDSKEYKNLVKKANRRVPQDLFDSIIEDAQSTEDTDGGVINTMNTKIDYGAEDTGINPPDFTFEPIGDIKTDEEYIDKAVDAIKASFVEEISLLQREIRTKVALELMSNYLPKGTVFKFDGIGNVSFTTPTNISDSISLSHLREHYRYDIDSVISMREVKFENAGAFEYYYESNSYWNNMLIYAKHYLIQLELTDFKYLTQNNAKLLIYRRLISEADPRYTFLLNQAIQYLVDTEDHSNISLENMFRTPRSSLFWFRSSQNEGKWSDVDEFTSKSRDLWYKSSPRFHHLYFEEIISQRRRIPADESIYKREIQLKEYDMNNITIPMKNQRDLLEHKSYLDGYFAYKSSEENVKNGRFI